jgi:hypothetical protein
MMKDKNRAVLEQHLTSINMMLPKVRQGSSAANNRIEHQTSSGGINRENSNGSGKDSMNT